MNILLRITALTFFTNIFRLQIKIHFIPAVIIKVNKLKVNPSNLRSQINDG